MPLNSVPLNCPPNLSIVAPSKNYSEGCSPGGQITPTPRSSILHATKLSQMPHGGGHLSHNCDLYNYCCAYGLRLQPNDYIRIAALANRIANGSDPNIDIWVPMLQMDRSEYWHLVIWVPMLQMDRSEYWQLVIWVPMLRMDRSEYWHLGTNVANGSITLHVIIIPGGWPNIDYLSQKSPNACRKIPGTSFSQKKKPLRECQHIAQGLIISKIH